MSAYFLLVDSNSILESKSRKPINDLVTKLLGLNRMLKATVG